MKGAEYLNGLDIAEVLLDVSKVVKRERVCVCCG